MVLDPRVFLVQSSFLLGSGETWVPSEEQVFEVSPTFSSIDLRFVNCIMKACHDTHFAKGVPFIFAEREDFSFEDEQCFLLKSSPFMLSLLIHV